MSEELLKNIINILSESFYLQWEFYIGILNILVLGATLYWVWKYTKETQKMKEEMIHQRIMKDAIDLSLCPSIAVYDLSTDEELQAVTISKPVLGLNNSICSYFLMDSNEIKLGRPNRFTNECTGMNYYMDLESRKKLLLTLVENKGKIKALVSYTSGNKFIYTYKALTNGYIEAESKQNHHPKGGGGDTFVLIKKEISN